MDESPEQSLPAAPVGSAPPTSPRPLPPRPTSWPTVVGTICIVLGVLGALGNVWTVVAISFQMAVPIRAGSQMARMWDTYFPWLIAHGVTALVLSIMLLAAGIGLAQRRRWGARTAMIWAALRAVLVPLGAFLTFLSQQAQYAVMEKSTPQGGPAPVSMGTMMQVMIVVTVAFSLVWGLALPVFLIWWLRRRTIRPEVAGWK